MVNLMFIFLLSLNIETYHKLVIYPPEDTLYFKDHPVGGILLFKKHFNDIEKLKKYIESAKRNNPYNMKIFVDMEGGLVNRLSDIMDFPSAEEMAEDMSPQQIEEISYKMGKIMKDIGIDVNLAPCVDYDIGLMGKQKRSFKDPMKNLNKIKGFIRGMKKAKIEVVIKHFPGYIVNENTDIKPCSTDINIVSLTKYIDPFAALSYIADGIMVSSIVYEKIDTLPAALSKRIVDMAHNLNKNMFVITDDLNTPAMKKYGDIKTVINMAIKAGNQYIILSTVP